MPGRVATPLRAPLNIPGPTADPWDVLRRSARLVALYLLGILLLGGWSLSHVLAGTVTRENFALVVVLPLAWTLSYWPSVGSLLMAWKIWRLQATLEEWCERRSLGLPADCPQQEVEDALTRWVARENGIPERWARRLVRRVGAALERRAAREGTTLADVVARAATRGQRGRTPS